MATSREQALQELLIEARNGGVVIHSDAEASRLLDWFAAQKGIAPEKVQALTLGKDIFIRSEVADNVRILREELIHVAQQAASTATDELVQSEIDARLQMIARRHVWGITNNEVREMIADVRHMRRTGRY